ncbi:methyltransferase domain-containing protein [Synechococcus sp. H55.7]|uniref:class I SAM-dependent methyltransferase n=1 Tax=unclassified Synechococcus TaxID=2626047 RepID=UPI0039C48F88
MFNLHIGGREPHPDWKILDVLPSPEVDYVANAIDLSLFGSESVDQIYASHVLEHFDYREAKVALTEWYRVLKKGGRLYISVPNLKALSRVLLKDDLSYDQLVYIISMFYGGQVDQYDFHKYGYTIENLTHLLKTVGFDFIVQVDQFGMFNDASTIVYCNELISLNVIAHKE